MVLFWRPESGRHFGSRTVVQGSTFGGLVVSLLGGLLGGFQDMRMEGFKARPLEGPGEGIWSVRDMSWFQARGPVGSE